MAGRTDPYVVVVKNNDTGQRFQFVGKKADCDEAAAAQVKEWGKKSSEVVGPEKR